MGSSDGYCKGSLDETTAGILDGALDDSNLRPPLGRALGIFELLVVTYSGVLVGSVDRSMDGGLKGCYDGFDARTGYYWVVGVHGWATAGNASDYCGFHLRLDRDADGVMLEDGRELDAMLG